MTCYYQNCNKYHSTKEHIPPKCFFPSDQRKQLLTVPSCKAHNNDKSGDDMYVLTHICLNASPNNGARDIFKNVVVPQLGYNNNSFRNELLKNSVELQAGHVAYAVNILRFNKFFDALSCGLIYKNFKSQLPSHYSFHHIYHDFIDLNVTNSELDILNGIDRFYNDKSIPPFMSIGKLKNYNEHIYTVKIIGLPDFAGSITIVHHFYGVFKVTSMISKL
jgi:hypothetical protein